MSDLVLQVGVKVLIKNSEGKYLFLKRATAYPGEDVLKWDIPGGRINIGESQKDALAREVKEETSLILDSIEDPLLVQDIIRDKHVVRITYIGYVKEGEIILDPAEHSEYGWLTIDEVKDLPHDLFLDPVFEILTK